MIFLLLSQLGLRRVEVANLTLDDIDWVHGKLRVHGKGSCCELPLPEAVGESLARYIQRDRLQIKSIRFIFLKQRAPIGPLSPLGIHCYLAALCSKAGIKPIGCHQLRHTFAMQMLKRGSTLEEIGQLLRHRGIATTAIYAQVDEELLASVVRPWPRGGGQ